MRLERLLMESAQKQPDAVCIRGPDGQMSYAELDRESNKIARTLIDHGVCPGGRVCIWLDKSSIAVAAMQATLRVGAAYVPLDPQSPVARIATMLQDCCPHALVTTSERAKAALTGSLSALPCLVVDGSWRGLAWDAVLARSGARLDPEPAAGAGDDAPAYILYTSGSTGTPKGVCISHRSAWAFIDWAAHTIDARADDHFSNHAPLHFDLSVLDLYVAFATGARVSLAPTGISYLPGRLVDFIRDESITVWYSVPSALTMMMDAGGLLGDPELEPRVLIFAGEPFPLPHLSRLRRHWQKARFFNFYGPTETNVCTAYELPSRDIDALLTLPIGIAASGDRVWLETDDGRTPGVGEIGELVVAGPTVMLGYWGKEPQGDRPYRTGDLARFNQVGQLEFVGRRDDMVKVRGHRVELGEIEGVLHAHEHVREAAVAVAGEGRQARLIAFLVSRDGHKPSLLAIKQLCAKSLPRYMIVDRVEWLSALPRTRNGKLDRRRLLESMSA